MNKKHVQISHACVNAINQELAYQSKIGDSRANNRDNGVSGQLLTMEEYFHKARAAWVMNSGDRQALDQIRKIVATGVRAMECYGIIERTRLSED